MKKYTIPVQITFTGEVFVNAESKEEAEDIVRKNFYVQYGGASTSPGLDDVITNWEVDMTGDVRTR